MNDQNNTHNAEQEIAEQEALAAVPSVMGWELLRQAREEAGVPLESLAAVLKVPVRKLEALEAGDLNDGADLTFSRALAASVCRQLRVDVQPILAAWPKSNPAAKKPLHSINDGAPGAATALPPAKREGGGIIWAVVVLALAGVGLWLAIEQTQTSGAKRASNQDQRALAQAQVEVNAPSVIPSEKDAMSNVQSAAGANTNTNTNTTTTNTEAATVTEQTVVEPAASLPVAVAGGATISTPGTPAANNASANVGKSTKALSAAQIANHLLVLQATAESWVEITDAVGNRVFTSLMLPGDYAVLDQPSGMAVVVGNAAGVVAHSRGKPVDVQGNARGNVSRFEIR